MFEPQDIHSGCALRVAAAPPEGAGGINQFAAGRA
jgi:hypothetical protein